MTNSPSKFPRIDAAFDRADGCLDTRAGLVAALIALVLFAIFATCFFGLVFYLLGLMVKLLEWLTT